MLMLVSTTFCWGIISYVDLVLMKLGESSCIEVNKVVASDGGALSSDLGSMYSGQHDRFTVLDRDIA